MLPLLMGPNNWRVSPPQPDQLIAGAIAINTISVIFGKWGSHKTFIALHMGICIAHGLWWFGRKTTQNPVLYIVAEGAWDVENRTNALFKEMGTDNTGFYLFPHGIQLQTPEGLNLLTRLCNTIMEETGKAPYVVVTPCRGIAAVTNPMKPTAS
jgi:hypothetical protein